VAVSIQAELDCDAVVRGFPGLPAPYVQVFSHVKPEVAGIPDRLYFVRGVALWFEVKFGRDKLTAEQFAFLERVYCAGGIVAAGDAVALRAMIYGSPPSQWREPGWKLVADLKAKGFRDG
jgi:hypothetical protein